MHRSEFGVCVCASVCECARSLGPVKTHTLPAHGLMPGPALHECGRIASQTMHNLSLKIFEVTDNSQLLLEKVKTTWKPFENVCHYSRASAVGSFFWVKDAGCTSCASSTVSFLGGGGEGDDDEHCYVHPRTISANIHFTPYLQSFGDVACCYYYFYYS